MRQILVTLALFCCLLCLAKAAAAQEENPCTQAVQAANPQEQIELWTECLETPALDKKAQATVYSNRGNAKLAADDIEGAIVDFSKAVDLQPENAKLVYNRALAFGQADKLNKAIEDLDRAIELNPEMVPAYFNRGSARYNIGNYQGAADDFTEVLRLKPNHAEAHAKRAFARKALGLMDLAREDARIARNLDPGVTVPAFPD